MKDVPSCISAPGASASRGIDSTIYFRGAASHRERSPYAHLSLFFLFPVKRQERRSGVVWRWVAVGRAAS